MIWFICGILAIVVVVELLILVFGAIYIVLDFIWEGICEIFNG